MFSYKILFKDLITEKRTADDLRAHLPVLETEYPSQKVLIARLLYHGRPVPNMITKVSSHYAGRCTRGAI